MEDSTEATLYPPIDVDVSELNTTAFTDYTELVASQLAENAFVSLSPNASDSAGFVTSSPFIPPLVGVSASDAVWDAELVVKLIGVLVLSLLCVIGGFANATVLIVFVRRPALRNRSNRYVMNLLSINLVSCGLLLPLAVTDILTSSTFLCVMGEAVTAGICASSALGVLLVAADQYRAILRPLQYHATRSASSKHIAAALMTSTWVGGVLCGVLSLLDLQSENAFWHNCPVESSTWHLGVNSRHYFAICYVVFVFCLPVSTLCWLYACIYTEAHQNSKRARRNGSAHENMLETAHRNSQPLLVSPQTAPTTRIVSSLKHRISNASLFKYREEARAARISVLVVFMSILCWSPYCTILLLRTWLHIRLPQYALSCSVILLSCTSIVSPALFAYRSRRLQREVKKLISCQSKHYTLPTTSFLARDKWQKRAALAAVVAATLASTPDKVATAVVPSAEQDDSKDKNASTSVINVENPTSSADTSRSSFSSGTTQGTSATDIE